MGKKKKGKSQKYAKISSDESGKSGKSKQSKGEQGGNKPPRRSNRTRRPLEVNGVDDYKFRREVEGMTEMRTRYLYQIAQCSAVVCLPPR